MSDRDRLIAHRERDHALGSEGVDEAASLRDCVSWPADRQGHPLELSTAAIEEPRIPPARSANIDDLYAQLPTSP